MAYFSNATEGDVFVEQCTKCKYGQLPCPVALIQMEFNYDAVDNKIATAIMDILVKQDGACSVWKMAQKEFEINPNQLEMFDE